MEARALGPRGPVVSTIGLGTWALGGHGYGPVDEQAATAVVRKALEVGITFFDTADVYGFGESERRLRKALGPDRHNVCIATKFGVAWDDNGRTWKDASGRRAQEALEASMLRLGVDCIPLYQIHWPDPNSDIRDTLDVLVRAREAGKIRHIGCSNFDNSHLEIVDHSQMVSVQHRFNLVERGCAATIADAAGSFGLGVIAYSVLARGSLTGKFTSPVSFGAGDTRSVDRNFEPARLQEIRIVADMLHSIAVKYKRDTADVAIRWVLDHPSISCALVGAKSVDQLLRNAASDGWRLAEEDWKALNDLPMNTTQDGRNDN